MVAFEYRALSDMNAHTALTNSIAATIKIIYQYSMKIVSLVRNTISPVPFDNMHAIFAFLIYLLLFYYASTFDMFMIYKIPQDHLIIASICMPNYHKPS